MKYRILTYPLFWVSLFLVFQNFILDTFAYKYTAFYSSEFSFIKTLISFSIVSLLLFLILRKTYTFSEYLIYDTIFYLSTVPNSILFSFGIVNVEILFYVFLWNLIPILPKVKFSAWKLKINGPRFLALVSLLTIVTSIYVIERNKNLISLNSLALTEEIYDIRSEYGGGNNGFVRYIGNWMAKFIIPSLIIYYGLRRKTIKLAFFILIGLLLFFINPHKSTLFITILSISLSYLSSLRNYVKIINWGFLVSMLLPLFFLSESISYIFVRRVFIVPAYLNYVYFEVFSDFKMYLSHSSLNFFMKNPLGISPTTFVSLKHFQAMGHSNNGIISSGYMNFGHFGVAMNLMSFHLLVSVICRSNNQIVIYLILPIIFTLLSSSFIQSITSHGILFIVILAITNLKNNKQEIYA